ncbi:hypothetical protein BLNAU_9920 [Blattamonas nauphoetae]|uniref:Uncharacterized protein n=1 Tax=Blattamonas nauphoetae TaxID=2049346 RepID=A0ABQ9XUN9_9EUKA|nr:hypothetical protein BLNAU_9920 [Blattamonas nauphoetae]
MTAFNKKTSTSSDTNRSVLFSPELPFPMDCFPFLNWTNDRDESFHEKTVVFRSLVATVKIQPLFNVSLEAKAVQFLESVTKMCRWSADAFLNSFERTADESLTDFAQSIVVLISSPSLAIIKAAMKILGCQISWCSTTVRLALVKADLISQLIVSLHPLSLSFADAVDIHVNLITILNNSVTLATQNGLAQLTIEAVQETTFQQVLAPSKKYICHLCVKRYSILDGEHSEYFLTLLVRLLRICPSYQPTMNFVLHMPIFVTIPSCLAFIKHDEAIYRFLYDMNCFQRDWNEIRGSKRQTSKIVHRMLRMEGIEDLIEAKLQNDENTLVGRLTVTASIGWTNLQGMNLPVYW